MAQSPYSYAPNRSPYSRTQERYAKRPCRSPHGRPQTPLRDKVVTGACIAAIVLVTALVACIMSCSGAKERPVTPGAGPASTPVSQWQAGTMPNLYQIDPTWASEPYAGATVGESGCGPTCLSMVYVYLTGKTDLTPPQMAAFSERNGYVERGMTAWRLMTAGSSLLGLQAEELSANESTVAAALDSGRPIICSLGPGDFTTVGHFIVLCGRDENGNARVYDPNSAERSAQGWSLGTILGQTLNLWAFSRA